MMNILKDRIGSDRKQNQKTEKKMAANTMRPTFAYTVMYVKDVAKSVEFYSRAFGHNVRRLDESHRFVDNNVNDQIIVSLGFRL